MTEYQFQIAILTELNRQKEVYHHEILAEYSYDHIRREGERNAKKIFPYFSHRKMS